MIIIKDKYGHFIAQGDGELLPREYHDENGFVLSKRYSDTDPVIREWYRDYRDRLYRYEYQESEHFVRLGALTEGFI